MGLRSNMGKTRFSNNKKTGFFNAGLFDANMF